MACSGAGSSSDASRATGSFDYQVFVSFRGSDAHRGFADLLYNSLIDAGVRVFWDDDELRVGEVLGENLLSAIDNSVLDIPIFSPTYASSKWCLRELAHIVDTVSKSKGERSVIPIYFDVEPEDVKLKTPLYSDALLEHAKNFPDEVDAWRSALKEVGEREGWNLKMDQSQAAIIKLVVREVLEKLKIKQKLVNKHFIGLDDQIKDLTELLDVNHDDVRLIGICGMGGIGKTTVAKMVFNQLSPHFGKCCSFLEGVRQSSLTKEGIVLLQKKLLYDIGGSVAAENIYDCEEGMRRIGAILSNKKVLLVLDDVDEKDSIKNLIANSKLRGGSRIIVTTRDEANLHVEGFEDKIYIHKMQIMNDGLALRLFCRYAFRKDYPSNDYRGLSREIVSCTGGLPLAIEVVGSSLEGKDKAFWEETLVRLKKLPEENILEKLRISSEKLEIYQKQIFLDIACFFFNENKTNAIYMWDDCHFYPIRGIEVLTERGLIKVLDNGKFWMHNQLKALGRQIVREESLGDLGKQSRLWIAKEALEIIKSEERKHEVQAIEIDGRDDSMEVTKEELESLPNLRFLKLVNGTFAGDFARCHSRLRWISWCSPHQDFRADNLHLDHLVVFKLEKSGFTDDSKAWDLMKRSHNLKVLCLTECHGITTIPDFSKCLSLERLTIVRCERLKRIERFIGHLSSLIGLEIEGCKDLANLPEEVGALTKLVRLSLRGCSGLRKLPGSIGNITSLIELDLSCTGIAKLPNSIQKLVSLECFLLRDTRITELPASIEKLKSLRILCLPREGFSSPKHVWPLPSGISMLENLEELDLSGRAEMKGEIPVGIGKLPSLRTLCLRDCHRIQAVPELPTSLTFLLLQSKSLLSVPNLSNLTNLVELRLSDDSRETGKTNLLPGCDLWWIGRLSRLKKLYINLLDVPAPQELAFLSHLEELTLCQLDLETVLQLPSSHWSLGNLSILEFCQCEAEAIPLERLPRLEKLTVDRCRRLERLSIPLELRKLHQVWVSHCPELVEIQVLGLSKSLKSLRVLGCESLGRIGGSSYLKNLAELEIQRCNVLTQVEGLRDLWSLRSLVVKECTSLRWWIDTSCVDISDDCPVETGERGDFSRQGVTSLKPHGEKITLYTVDDLRHLLRRYTAESMEEMEVEYGPPPGDMGTSDCNSTITSVPIVVGIETSVSSVRNVVGMETSVSDSNCTITSVRNVDGIDDRAKMEVNDERMEELQDESGPPPADMESSSGPPPADMESSDRNYAIAAVQNVVGIGDQVKQITDLLEMEVDDEVRIIGIYGADGIGKTTLAKAIYNGISSCFDSRSFLAEVDETTRDPHGIQFLQTRLVCHILKRDCEDPSFDERIEDFLDVFRERKVLIVVDDVKERCHLHAIVGEQLDWFGPGSRIIVTSENEEILKEYDSEKARTYPVSALDDGQAFELFCKHAFGMQSSIPDYDGLANRIVNATGKLPLAVEVVGSFLRGKSIQKWEKMESSMKERMRISQKTTVGFEQMLDICYKGLDKKQKEIFLDMACFISGVDARIASLMWPSSCRPSSGCVLMPLAKIGENNELQMHRLPRSLGKRISDQEESKEPRSRRFCTQDMVLKAMNRETGTGKVEALCLDFTPRDSRRMPNIRFLKLHNARFSGYFAGAFASLRWLCWQRCPPDFSAENLVLKRLVILDLSWSKVTEDWGGWGKIKMEKLKALNLTGCSDLLFTPDFSGYKDLEILILEGCSRLVKLHPSIGHLKRLVSLNLKFCSRLNSLPVEMGGMTALKELFIDGTSVREIPISIGNMKKLEILSGFECFPLTHLPRSICYLTALTELSFDGAKITRLSSSLGDLLRLRRLSLRSCRHLEELPDSIGRMGSLEELDISGTRISELPGSIGNLESLKVLRMDYSFIRAFPGEIGNLTNLEELHASWCWSLKGPIPSNVEGLRNLRSLTLGHSRISSLPPEISTIPGLHSLDLIQCNEIEELPELPPSLIHLRVSSARMKVIPLLEDLKELEELCLSDGDPMECQRPSKQPMPESNVIDEQFFSISLPKLRKLELSLLQVIKLKFGPTDIPPPKRLKMLTHAGSSRKEVLELPQALSVLKLYDSAIEEIEGLEGLDALKRLDISNCRIRNLDGIGQLTSLRSLTLSDCDCLNSLDVSKLKSLKVLEIRRCKMICQIEGLDKLAPLVKPNISECPALIHVTARSTVM